MLVKILGVEIDSKGTYVTFNCDVREAFVSLPGSIYQRKKDRRLFPHQFSVPQIIEYIKFAEPLHPKVYFTLEEDFPITYTKKYIRRTYLKVGAPPPPLHHKKAGLTKDISWTVKG
jgi:hypothetical protein